MRKIITPSELGHHSKSALSALFRQVAQELADSEPGSPERRDALTSLENIQRAINTRRAQRPKPPGF